MRAAAARLGVGLDTLATISLNGQELGQTNNMFRQYRWDVKKLLKQSNNILLVYFQSPVTFISEKQKNIKYNNFNGLIPAQCGTLMRFL